MDVVVDLAALIEEDEYLRFEDAVTLGDAATFATRWHASRACLSDFAAVLCRVYGRAGAVRVAAASLPCVPAPHRVAIRRYVAQTCAWLATLVVPYGAELAAQDEPDWARDGWPWAQSGFAGGTIAAATVAAQDTATMYRIAHAACSVANHVPYRARLRVRAQLPPPHLADVLAAFTRRD